MDAMQAQAMLIRHEAALRLLEHADEDGRYWLLSEIVDPSEDILNSSLEEAERRGISGLAHAMAATKPPPKGKMIRWSKR